MPLDTNRPQYEFKFLLDADQPTLLRELADTHSKLANLHEEIAFNKALEFADKSPVIRAQRTRDEGIRAAYEEKKWLIVRLLELANGNPA